MPTFLIRLIRSGDASNRVLGTYSYPNGTKRVGVETFLLGECGQVCIMPSYYIGRVIVYLTYIIQVQLFVFNVGIGIVSTQATQPDPNLEEGFGIVYMLK